MIHEILGQRSLRVEREDNLYEFICNGIETTGEIFCLLALIRFEYCSANVTTGFFARHSEHSYEIKASMWTSLRARLVLSNMNKAVPSIDEEK
jgi:hypothetical protein